MCQRIAAVQPGQVVIRKRATSSPRARKPARFAVQRSSMDLENFGAEDEDAVGTNTSTNHGTF
jgi:hypothetical protein